MSDLTPEKAHDIFSSHQALAKKAKEVMDSDQGAQQFQQEFSKAVHKEKDAHDLTWE